MLSSITDIPKLLGVSQKYDIVFFYHRFWKRVSSLKPNHGSIQSACSITNQKQKTERAYYYLQRSMLVPHLLKQNAPC